MIILATTLLLASSSPAPGSSHFPTNAMLREATVSHDMARVKRQFEQSLHGSAEPDHQALTLAEPPTAR